MAQTTRKILERNSKRGIPTKSDEVLQLGPDSIQKLENLHRVNDDIINVACSQLNVDAPGALDASTVSLDTHAIERELNNYRKHLNRCDSNVGVARTPYVPREDMVCGRRSFHELARRLNGRAFFEQEELACVLIPLFSSQHWSLLVLHTSKGILHYDSLGFLHTPLANLAVSMLVDAGMLRKKRKIVSAAERFQVSDWQCGYVVLALIAQYGNAPCIRRWPKPCDVAVSDKAALSLANAVLALNQATADVTVVSRRSAHYITVCSHGAHCSSCSKRRLSMKKRSRNE